MLTLVGMNHRSAPLDLRERARFAEEDLPAVLSGLKAEVGAAEALIVATCNRVEILTRAAAAPVAGRAIRAFLAAQRGLSTAEVEAHVYVYEGLEAARHVFTVAAGSTRWCSARARCRVR